LTNTYRGVAATLHDLGLGEIKRRSTSHKCWRRISGIPGESQRVGYFHSLSRHCFRLDGSKAKTESRVVAQFSIHIKITAFQKKRVKAPFEFSAISQVSGIDLAHELHDRW
jgi:hypothetical protein